MSKARLDIVAHELRSPVAALSAIAAAYGESDAATRSRLVAIAWSAGSNIYRLLADTTMTSLRIGRVDVSRLVGDVVETAALRGAKVVTRPEAGLTISGDTDRVRQALANLIDNAIGHSPAGGTVTVAARRVGVSVAIAVTDEGDGIDPDDFERIFDEGVRLTSTRPGSGLGLAVVRAIAVAHGGLVEVESSEGQGTTFTLVLPGAFSES